MASCSYSSIVKVKSSFPCGSNWKNPEDFSCVTLRDCNLNIASHLTSCKVADNRIENEVQLLLARAGTVLLFIIVFSDFSIYLWILYLAYHVVWLTLCRGVYYWRVSHIADSVSTTSGKIWGWLVIAFYRGSSRNRSWELSEYSCLGLNFLAALIEIQWVHEEICFLWSFLLADASLLLKFGCGWGLVSVAWYPNTCLKKDT